MFKGEFIAGVMRASKPVDRRLRDGWLHACFAVARHLQADDACFDPLKFLDLASVSADDELKWRVKYDRNA